MIKRKLKLYKIFEAFEKMLVNYRTSVMKKFSVKFLEKNINFRNNFEENYEKIWVNVRKILSKFWEKFEVNFLKKIKIKLIGNVRENTDVKKMLTKV